MKGVGYGREEEEKEARMEERFLFWERILGGTESQDDDLGDVKGEGKDGGREAGLDVVGNCLIVCVLVVFGFDVCVVVSGLSLSFVFFCLLFLPVFSFSSVAISSAIPV